MKGVSDAIRHYDSRGREHLMSQQPDRVRQLERLERRQRRQTVRAAVVDSRIVKEQRLQ